MTDDKHMSMEPVTISIVGTGTGSGGGVAPTPDGTIAKTPNGQPNLVVQVIGPVRAIMVRFVHLYLVTLSGLIAASFTPGGNAVLGAGDFQDMVWRCASLAIAAPGVGLIKDLITVFGRLEGKYPLATGSI